MSVPLGFTRSLRSFRASSSKSSVKQVSVSVPDMQPSALSARESNHRSQNSRFLFVGEIFVPAQPIQGLAGVHTPGGRPGRPGPAQRLQPPASFVWMRRQAHDLRGQG